MQFVDSQNRSWSIELTIGDVLRLKKESEGRFNLLEPEKRLQSDGREVELRTLLDVDLAEFFECLAILLEPQRAERGTSVEQFGLAMQADHLIAAQSAFFTEWIDFFQKLQRPDAAVTLEKLRKYRELAVKKVRQKLQETELAAIDRRVEATMEAALNESSGRLLDDLDSILAPIPGDSSP